MDAKQLLSKETFINFFKLSEIDKIEKKNELILEAKKLGIEKMFKSAFKEYEKLLTEKIGLETDIKLPKSKFKIENYNMGDYSCTINGILDKNNFKFSNIPVLPVERYINKETNREKVKIIFYKENNWQEKTVDRSQLAISQKLLLLSDDGLDVNSNNVRSYIDYFSTIMSLNDIKKLESISHIGWRDDLFIPYDTKGIFDGEDDFRNIYNAISSKGNYQKWKDTINELRKHKIIRILMAITLASPLLEKLSLQPFIVNLWSSLSGNGKTLSCMIAMSIWGNPDTGALRLSSNNTQNYYVTVASFLRNYTVYFDELQIIKNSKYINLEALVMDLCNGTDKGRLTKNSQAKEIKTWHNNFLFTSNDKLVKSNNGEQVYNRVIDVEIREKIIEKGGNEIARIIKNNYGFAGKDYIKYIQSVGFDEISKMYNEIFEEILEKTQATSKQASSLATILLADKLAHKCIFNDNSLMLEDMKEFINDKEEIRTSIKAKKYIKNIIDLNNKRFEEQNYGECWGKFKVINTTYDLCYINVEVLKRELQKGGFEFDSVKKEWADMNFLQKNTADRYVHQTTVFKQHGGYVVLDLHI